MSTTSVKPLLLYTGRTANGNKVNICISELKAAYPATFPDVEIYPIDIGTNVQKEPWFIAINPNGRIPALIDRSRSNFVVFESAAILLYLTHHYDPQNLFTFDVGSDEESEMMQWMFFAHGGVGPMMGQAIHFMKFAPEGIEYAVKRYQDETKRLLGVLEIRLKDREYLVGEGKGRYSIADFNVWPWASNYAYVDVEVDGLPNFKGWVERIRARPAVQAGLNSVVPENWQTAKK